MAEMAALKIGCVCVQRVTGTHAEGENLYLCTGWKECGQGAVCGSANGRGGKGGEDEDEGRVGVRTSDNRPKHHKQPRRPREEAWMGTGRGALYIH